MGRSSRCDIASGIRRGQWTADEDQKLFTYIQQHGHGSWSLLPEKAGLQRCGKSCRFRWTNYLRPGIKRGDFSLHEEQTIIQLHALLGNRWSAIAMYLPKRTDNEIKNHWNTHLKKRLARSGIDPVTHKSRISTIASMSINGNADSKNASKLSHMAQWESVRLEAEARSVRESKLRGSEPVNNMATRNINVPPRCLDVLTAWQNIVRNDDKTGQSINPLALRGEEQNIDQRDHMDVEEIYGTHVQQLWNDNEDNVDWEPSYIYMRPSIL